MSVKALAFAVTGLVVAGFYALESFLGFQANGFSAPLLVKLLICGAGVYVFVRNVGRIKGNKPDDASANAA
jgi:hypothetical protein